MAINLYALYCNVFTFTDKIQSVNGILKGYNYDFCHNNVVGPVILDKSPALRSKTLRINGKIQRKRNITRIRVLGAHNLQDIDSYIPSKNAPQKRGYRRDLLGTEKKH